MSVTKYLGKVLKPPVYYVVSKDEKTDGLSTDKIKYLHWNRHGNLVEAQEFLLESGIKLSDFKLILIIVRNPFQMDLSFYKHLKTKRYYETLAKNSLNEKLLNAALSDYKSFAKQPFTHYKGNLKDYFEIEGKKPANLKVVKFETLSTEIPELIEPFSIKNCPFPHENKSDPYKESNIELSIQEILSIKRKYFWIWKRYYPENENVLNDRNAILSKRLEKKYLFISGWDKFPIKRLTTTLNFHSQIVIESEGYDHLMKKENFCLSKIHFSEDKFCQVYPDYFNCNENPGNYSQSNILKKWENIQYVGLNYPGIDRIFNELFFALGSFKVIYIIMNIFSLLNLKSRKFSNTKSTFTDDEFVKIINRWNHSLVNITKALDCGDEVICVCYEDLLGNFNTLIQILNHLELKVEDYMQGEYLKKEQKTLKIPQNIELTLLQKNYLECNARIDLYDKLTFKG